MASVCLLYSSSKRNDRASRQGICWLVFVTSSQDCVLYVALWLTSHWGSVRLYMSQTVASGKQYEEESEGQTSLNPRWELRAMLWLRLLRPAKVRKCVYSLGCCISAIVNPAYGTAAAACFVGFVLCWWPIASVCPYLVKLALCAGRSLWNTLNASFELS